MAAAADDAKQNDKKAVPKGGKHPIPFSVNVKEFVGDALKTDKRKIMIALDGTEYAKAAAEWVHKNLARDDDYIILLSIWEEAMIEKLYKELDSEIIHPDVDMTHSKHNRLNETFEPARCLADHDGCNALLVEANARVNPKSIGQELCELAKSMKVDCIVCGTRGLGGIKKAFLGSVSTYISENATCTTLIVRK